MSDGQRMISFALHREKMEALQAKQKDRLAEQRTKLLRQVQEKQAHFIEMGKKAGTVAHVAATAARFMRDGDVVLDCGANVGAFTAPFAPTPATVFGFEPNPDCVAHFRARFSDCPNVTVEQVAVGAETGHADLIYHAHYTPDVAHDKSSEGSSIVPSMSRLLKGHSHRVDVIDIVERIEILMAEGRNIAVLKLDIEGSELEVLERMYDLDLFSKITLCLVETHERNFPDLADRFSKIRDKISTRYDPSHVFLDWI